MTAMQRLEDWLAMTRYTLDDLRLAFGESRATVRTWIRKGMFGRRAMSAGSGGISERAVIRFVAKRDDTYNLLRVDPFLFRALAFAELPPRPRKRGGLL